MNCLRFVGVALSHLEESICHLATNETHAESNLLTFTERGHMKDCAIFCHKLTAAKEVTDQLAEVSNQLINVRVYRAWKCFSKAYRLSTVDVGLLGRVNRFPLCASPDAPDNYQCWTRSLTEWGRCFSTKNRNFFPCHLLLNMAWWNMFSLLCIGHILKSVGHPGSHMFLHDGGGYHNKNEDFDYLVFISSPGVFARWVQLEKCSFNDCYTMNVRRMWTKDLLWMFNV